MGLLQSIENWIGPQGKINQGLEAGMQSPLFNLGLGLLNAAQPFSNPGQDIQQAMGNMLAQRGMLQQQAMNQMQLRMMQQQFPLMMNTLQQSRSLWGGAPAAGSAPAPTSGATPTAAAPQQIAAPAPTAAPTAAPLGADPFAMLRKGTELSLFPMTQKYGAALVDAAKTMIANDPNLATRMAAAKGALASDQYTIQQAQASGNPLALKAAQMKYLTDAGMLRIANNNGAVTTLGGITPAQVGAAGVNPEQGYQYAQGRESVIPGAPAAQAAIAGARAGGEEAGKAPYEMQEVTDAQGNKYLVPKSQLLAPGTPGGSRPAGAPAAPALAGLGPQAQAGLEGRGTRSQEYVMGSQEAADAATTSNYALDNVIQAARGASIGPGASAREFVEKNFTALGQSLLGDKFQPPKELGSYQELDKYGNQLGFATAKSMGSREAAQIVTMAIQSNPNKSLTPQAFGWIANSMKAMNNYIIAKNQALQAADKLTPGAAQQAGATWDSHVNPQAWDLALDPRMASQLAPKLGAEKIAAALPFMSSADAVAAFRNIPATMRAAVLAKMPAAAKQELAQGLQQ